MLDGGMGSPSSNANMNMNTNNNNNVNMTMNRAGMLGNQQQQQFATQMQQNGMQSLYDISNNI